MQATGDFQKPWVLMGASRGLGLAFAQYVQDAQPQTELRFYSRKPPEISQECQFQKADFSKPEDWPALVAQLISLNPQKLFYFAGGGPYGPFQTKEWKDHQWAWRVCFEFPAFLIHQFLQSGAATEIFVVGSSVAENSPDPQAASYCAAKHALRGLMTSLQAESSHSNLRLFSPGYLDTQMLPQHAWPRQQPGLVKSPKEVAKVLWNWIHNADDASKHFVLKSSL